MNVQHSKTREAEAANAAVVENFLLPGEYFVGHAPCRMRTVLGSCVSITLWHARLRIGAMSHFLLAERGGQGGSQADARYAGDALGLMLRELQRHQVPLAECQAKVFGGGDMFPATKGPRGISVGQRNGEAAHNLLRAHGIAVVSESLYGVGHRQLVFDVGSGDVWVRQLAPRLAVPGRGN